MLVKSPITIQQTMCYKQGTLEKLVQSLPHNVKHPPRNYGLGGDLHALIWDHRG